MVSEPAARASEGGRHSSPDSRLHELLALRQSAESGLDIEFGQWDCGVSMKKHAIHTDAAPQAIGPYSQAVTAGGFLFVSGQIGLDPRSGETVKGGIEPETERVLANLEGILSAHGLDTDSVVRTTIFLVDLANFAVVNQIYAKHFREPFPARVTVGVSSLPRGARIEIDAIAVTSKGAGIPS